jgi:hypothetical protein
MTRDACLGAEAGGAEAGGAEVSGAEVSGTLGGGATTGCCPTGGGGGRCGVPVATSGVVRTETAVGGARGMLEPGGSLPEVGAL